jgi:hypothetical protein
MVAEEETTRDSAAGDTFSTTGSACSTVSPLSFVDAIAAVIDAASKPPPPHAVTAAGDIAVFADGDTFLTSGLTCTTLINGDTADST